MIHFVCGAPAACALPKLLTRVSMSLRLIWVFFLGLVGLMPMIEHYADRHGRQ
jgi:hypothetical protein